MNYKNRNKEHIVYALILNEKPIYVGCTMDFVKRRSQHFLSKKFDYMIMIKKYDTKEEALNAENAIIRFMSLFNEKPFLNSLSPDVRFYKEFMDCGYPAKEEMEVNNG